MTTDVKVIGTRYLPCRHQRFRPPTNREEWSEFYRVCDTCHREFTGAIRDNAFLTAKLGRPAATIEWEGDTTAAAIEANQQDVATRKEPRQPKEKKEKVERVTGPTQTKRVPAATAPRPEHAVTRSRVGQSTPRPDDADRRTASPSGGAPPPAHPSHSSVHPTPAPVRDLLGELEESFRVARSRRVGPVRVRPPTPPA